MGDWMRHILAFLGAAVLAAMPRPALALECELSSIQREYWWHKEQPETYILVYGTLVDIESVRDDSKSTSGGANTNRRLSTAKFVGFRASRNAFDQPLETDVTLIFDDFYMFGADANDMARYLEGLSGTVGLVWMKETASGHEIDDELCADMVNTDVAQIKPALRCLSGRFCPKE
jgi:hypothetical protein